MSGSRLKERLGFALSPGGARATAWWIANRLLRTEAYRLMARHCVARTPPPASSRFELRFLSSASDVDSLSGAIMKQLESQTRQGLAEIVASGSTLFFLMRGDGVACQLLVTPGPNVRVDNPSGLRLEIGPEGAFVSYVFTHLAFRRLGAARELLARVEDHLVRRGIDFAVAHVSVTNVASLQTFTRAGWTAVGLLGFTRNGRLLFASQRGKRRIGISSEAGRARSRS